MITPVWIINIAFICGINAIDSTLSERNVYAAYGGLDTGWMVTFSIAALICATVLTCKILGARDRVARFANEQSEAASQPANAAHGRGFILGAVWLGSVILAYIAGEFSLISKAQEFVKAKLQQRFATTAKESSAENAPEPNPMPSGSTAG